MEKLRVLIVDDHALFRDGLGSLLERQSDMTVAGEAGDGLAAVRLAEELAPDVVLMDLHLPKRSGVDAIGDIVAARPDCRVIVLTMYHDDELIDRAFQAGATGFILKDSRAADLLNAIRTVASGGAAVDPVVAQQLLGLYRRSAPANKAAPPAARGDGSEPFPGLTEREIQLLGLLETGLGNRQIAEKLFLSQQTVKNLLSGIYRKLGAANRTEAVALAAERGLIRRRA